MWTPSSGPAPSAWSPPTPRAPAAVPLAAAYRCCQRPARVTPNPSCPSLLLVFEDHRREGGAPARTGRRDDVAVPRAQPIPRRLVVDERVGAEYVPVAGDVFQHDAR